MKIYTFKFVYLFIFVMRLPRAAFIFLNSSTSFHTFLLRGHFFHVNIDYSGRILSLLIYVFPSRTP